MYVYLPGCSWFVRASEWKADKTEPVMSGRGSLRLSWPLSLCKPVVCSGLFSSIFFLFEKYFSLQTKIIICSVQFSSVAQPCPTLCDPRIAALQASLSITNSQSSLRLTSIELVLPSSHLILCRPLLLLPLIPLSSSLFQ